MASDVKETPFVKALAANDRPTRDKAVESLRTYLGGRRTFEESDLLKLWKGLFFCMWMSDRPVTQQRLAATLADLVHVLPAENVTIFLKAFWATMAREWPNIDFLRMDKFMLLTRLYLAATFERLAKAGWEMAATKSNTDMLSSIPLSCKDQKIPNGLRYHVIDMYIDELGKVDDNAESSLPIDILLQPLESLKTDAHTKSVRQRAAEALDDERIQQWRSPNDEES